MSFLSTAWECARCTLHNGAGAAVCVACDAPRLINSSAVEEEEEEEEGFGGPEEEEVAVAEALAQVNTFALSCFCLHNTSGFNPV